MRACASQCFRSLWPLGLLWLLACGNDGPALGDGELLVRVEVGDNDAAFVGFRIWDENLELIADELRPRSEFPRYLRLFPEASDPRDARFRGARVEVESWSAELCPRGRATRAFRYGVSEPRQTLEVPAPDTEFPCRSLFVDPTAPSLGDTCTEAAPCGSIAEAFEEADETSGRFAVHVAGGRNYDGLNLRNVLIRRGAPVQNVIRAWPGRGLPAPRLVVDPPPDETAAAVSLCCDFFDDAPASLELDGFETSGGNRSGIEINGTRAVTVRHFTIQDGAGGDREISPSGVRVFESPGTVLEYNRILSIRDRTGTAVLPAVGILVDGADRQGPTAATLIGNRILSSESFGIRVSMPSGSVMLTGNAICGSGDSGLRIEGNNRSHAVTADGMLIVENGGPGVSIENWMGTVRVAGSTIVGSSPSLMGTPANELTGNVLVGVGPSAGNLVDPTDPLDLDGCLAGRPVSTGEGVCATFPECP
ncbi:MAG: right-handed parallel beta-helix repeat-containing protein [Myxococcota bacterium]